MKITYLAVLTVIICGCLGSKPAPKSIIIKKSLDDTVLNSLPTTAFNWGKSVAGGSVLTSYGYFYEIKDDSQIMRADVISGKIIAELTKLSADWNGWGGPGGNEFVGNGSLESPSTIITVDTVVLMKPDDKRRYINIVIKEIVR